MELALKVAILRVPEDLDLPPEALAEGEALEGEDVTLVLNFGVLGMGYSFFICHSEGPPQ
jgi:hypothetical protein